MEWFCILMAVVVTSVHSGLKPPRIKLQCVYVYVYVCMCVCMCVYVYVCVCLSVLVMKVTSQVYTLVKIHQILKMSECYSV